MWLEQPRNPDAPLAGLKVVELARVLAGPFCGQILADLGADAVKIQAQTFIRLCSGQIRDDRPCPEGADPREYYRGVLADKTGVLVATAARYGAMYGGCPPQVVELVTEYGEQLCMAF